MRRLRLDEAVRSAGPCRKAIAALLLTALCGCASSWPVDPGDPVTLDPDQGLLVVHIRTNAPLSAVETQSVRAAERVSAGTQLRLIGVTAGAYRWSRISVYGVPFAFRDVEELRFRVEPGCINYVGMLDVQLVGPLQLYLDSIDRSAMGLAALRERYPGIASEYPIVYSGPARHEFLPRLLQAEAERGEAEGE